MSFMQEIAVRQAAGMSVCVGLDTDPKLIPKHLLQGDQSDDGAVSMFNRSIVLATAEFALCFKMNLGFYLAQGPEGLTVLQDTVERIHNEGAVAILDGKFGDIGNSAEQYASFAFDDIEADAVTVNYYLGGEALKPFWKRADKGVFVLARTSNPGASELQGCDVSGDAVPGGYLPLYQYVAHCATREANENGNIGFVVGATTPDELRQVRERAPRAQLLIPGIGAQGGEVAATVTAGQDAQGNGMIINSSRAIIYASSGADFADAARREALKLHDLINQYRRHA